MQEMSDPTVGDADPRESFRQKWRHYLATCTTYGTQREREPEYQLAWDVMRHGGVTDRDLVVDVGAGDCGLDVYLRKQGFRGQVLPIDGSIQGIDLNDWLPEHRADWFVCLEVLEHIRRPIRLLGKMIDTADKGIVCTTPNPDVVDVLAVDPTHVCGICVSEFESFSMEVSTYTFNPGRGEGDTICAWRYRR